MVQAAILFPWRASDVPGQGLGRLRARVLLFRLENLSEVLEEPGDTWQPAEEPGRHGSLVDEVEGSLEKPDGPLVVPLIGKRGMEIGEKEGGARRPGAEGGRPADRGGQIRAGGLLTAPGEVGGDRLDRAESPGALLSEEERGPAVPAQSLLVSARGEARSSRSQAGSTAVAAERRASPTPAAPVKRPGSASHCGLSSPGR